METSSARWEPISTPSSFGNCAMAPGPSIWPWMPTLTAAANRPRKVTNSSGARCSYSPGLPARGPQPQQLLCRWRQCERVSTSVGGGLSVRFRVIHQRGLSNALSPFRVVEQTGREVDWVNRYLDQQRVRGVADSALRSSGAAVLPRTPSPIWITHCQLSRRLTIKIAARIA